MAEEPRPISRQAEPPCETEPALRLSIFHLMVWTFCSAAYLTWSRLLWVTRTEYPPDYVPIRQAMDVLQSLIIGAVLTGSITLAYAWTHGRAGWAVLRHPGHWLLLGQAVLIATVLPLSTVLAVLDFWHMNASGSFGVALYGLAQVFPTIIYCVAGIRTETRRWKWLFIGLIAVGIFDCLFYLSIWDEFTRGANVTLFLRAQSIQSCTRLVIPIYILVLATRDVVAGQQRDWLHWVGVTSYIAMGAATLLWMSWP